MYNDNILKRVIEIFSSMMEADEIDENSELMDDLGISSLDMLFLITSLEEEFSIKVPEKIIRNMITIGDVAEIITELIQ